MKTTILIFLLYCAAVFAQDFEPVQVPFTFGTNNNYFLSADSAYFRQEHFILGWAWSCGRKMSEAMLDNQGHVGPWYDANFQKSHIANNTNLVINAENFYDPGRGLTGTNSQSMCYSPVLQITNPGSISNVMPNDPRHLIFGFKVIDGESIGTNDVSLKLRKNGGYASNTIPVLDSAWTNNYLYWYSLGNQPPSFAPDVNTEQMYFVINLKRSDPSDDTLDDTPVLTISLT